MVSLPCGEEGADVGFRVGFAIVSGIGVGHGVFLGVGKKIRGVAFWRCAIGRVFEPGVILAGCGRVHSFCNFVSGWLRRHRFKQGL